MGEVIQGWDEGVKGMLRGEKRRLLVPAKLGYGRSGAPPAIPPNANLVFERVPGSPSRVEASRAFPRTVRGRAPPKPVPGRLRVRCLGARDLRPFQVQIFSQGAVHSDPYAVLCLRRTERLFPVGNPASGHPDNVETLEFDGGLAPEDMGEEEKPEEIDELVEEDPVNEPQLLHGSQVDLLNDSQVPEESQVFCEAEEQDEKKEEEQDEKKEEEKEEKKEEEKEEKKEEEKEEKKEEKKEEEKEEKKEEKIEEEEEKDEKIEEEEEKEEKREEKIEEEDGENPEIRCEAEESDLEEKQAFQAGSGAAVMGILQKHLFVWDVSVTAADLCPVKISMSSVRLLTWFGQGVALIMSSLSILLCWLDDSPHRFLGEGAWISFGALLMVLSSALLSGREACLSDPEEREEHWTTEDDAVDMRPRRVSFNTGPGPEPRGWSPARADLNARMKNFIQEMEQQVRQPIVEAAHRFQAQLGTRQSFEEMAFFTRRGLLGVALLCSYLLPCLILNYGPLT
eukprot:g19336.t1